MSFLPEFSAVLLIHTMGMVSPGPDFLMITKNSLIYSRRIGLFCSLGLTLGVLVHITYCLLGIGWITSKSILVFSVIKFLGAGYLVYIGLKSLRAKRKEGRDQEMGVRKDLNGWRAVRMGFMTNILNPKATMFFLAIFTQVIHPETPKAIQAFYGLTMSTTAFLYFAGIVALCSHPFVRSKLSSVQYRMEKVFGVLLIALGIKVAFSK